MGTQIVTAATQLTTEEQWARESRALVRRSRPAELLASDAENAEIKAALTPEIVAALEDAILGLNAEAMCAADHDDLEDALVIELGRYLALTAGSWTVEARKEWINVAVDELNELPLSALLPALKRARRQTPWPNNLVAAICEEVEPREQRLKDEAETLLTLKELAN